MSAALPAASVERLLIRADGAARGNPGPASAGAVLIDASRPDARSADAPPLAVIARPLGIQTNNFAEYTAVVLALEAAQRLGAQEVELVLDSKLVVEQLAGRWKVRNAALVDLHARARALLSGFRRWNARHEPRASNRAADALANLALDDPAAARAAEGGSSGEPPQRATPPRRMGDDSPAGLLRRLHEVLDETDAILQRYFAAELEPTRKADGSPVTAADREVESRLHQRLTDAFPSHGFIGEEHGEAGGNGDARWIVDPIDATANFVRGIPVFGTLVALERDGELVVSAVSAPALGQRWWAVAGQAAYTRAAGDTRQIRVSTVAALDEAQLLFATLRRLDASGRLDGWRAAAARAWRDRGFGDFWGHVLVAQGSAEAMLDQDLKVWDLAAPALIVNEAGGRVTDLEGRPTWRSGDVLSSNGHVHDELLGLLAGVPPSSPRG